MNDHRGGLDVVEERAVIIQCVRLLVAKQVEIVCCVPIISSTPTFAFNPTQPAPYTLGMMPAPSPPHPHPLTPLP